MSPYLCTAFATVALFTTQPTDRALAGWWGGPGWAGEEIDVLERYARTAPREGVA